MFTSGSSGPPKGVIHSHGNALGAVQSGLAARCIDADTRLYLPMPFFWVGGFGSGILSALLAGATLITEEIPQPETTLRLLERERVTLFRGWPDQAEALGTPIELGRRRSVGAAAGQPGGAAATRPARRAGCAGQVVRDDRGIRAVLRLPRRHRHAAIGVGQLRQAVRRHRGPHRRPRQRRTRAGGHDRHDPDSRTAHDARHLPAQPGRAVHRRRLLPHRRSRSSRRRRLHVLPRSIRRHVQGQRRHRLPQRGRAGAPEHRRRRRTPSSPMCPARSVPSSWAVCRSIT